LWRRAGLQVPRRRPRRRIAASRPRPLPPTGPNQVWAYDFVFDTCAGGQQLKCLTVVDEWTREALAIDVGSSIRSGRVIDLLSRLVSVRGANAHQSREQVDHSTGSDAAADVDRQRLARPLV